MAEQGREYQKDNDLFFTCSLIEYISRKTKNIRADVVNKLGKERISKIYDLADVYHCDNIDAVSDSFIEDADIVSGTVMFLRQQHRSAIRKAMIKGAVTAAGRIKRNFALSGKQSGSDLYYVRQPPGCRYHRVKKADGAVLLPSAAGLKAFLQGR